MSFFKKMKDKFEDLVGDDDKPKAGQQDPEQHEGTKDINPQYGQQPSYEQHSQYGQAPSGYGNQQQSFHGQPPSGGPPLPPGWISQWDPNSQRYYFLEQATGRTQWEPPQQGPGGYGPPMGQPQYGGAPGGYYSQEVQHSVDSHGNTEVYEKKEKSGKGGMLAGAAGGLAVGAIGGALVGHAMGDDSDEEHREQPAYVQQTTYYEGAPPPAVPPPGSEHGSVSSSDKEELEEAREDYENASDASDREEAREEYQEQYEETYGDD